MKYLLIVSIAMSSLLGYSQLEITDVILTEEEFNVLRYDLTFSTNEESYAFVNYYGIITDSLDNVLDTTWNHTALQGPAMNHEFKIMEMLQDTDYEYEIVAHNANSCVSADWETFTTDTVPWEVPKLDSLYVAEDVELEGYYLTNSLLVPEATLQIWNRDGEVVWYDHHAREIGQGLPTQCKGWSITDDNEELLLECHEISRRTLDGEELNYVDLNGTVHDSLNFHHDVIINSDGNYVAIAAGTVTYPSGDSTITVIEEGLMEVTPDGEVVWQWRAFDHYDITDAIPSNGFFIPLLGAQAVNWFHVNAVMQDTDGHYIISSKERSQLIKINSENGDVFWQFGGEDSDFPFQNNDPFGDQHDIKRTDWGTYILFDNTGQDSLSRIQELTLDFYDIPESVTVWDHTFPQEHFSAILGSVDRLPGGIRYGICGNKGAVYEVSQTGEVRWHMRQSRWGYRTYFIDEIFNNDIEEITMGNNADLVCIDETAFALNAEPANGCWSGAGVENGTFDPMTAGLGIHELEFRWGWNVETISIEVSDQVPPCAVKIEEIENFSGLDVFPNPTNGVLNINLEVAQAGIATADVFNYTGQLVSSEQFSITTGKQLLELKSFETLSNGLYQVKVTVAGKSRSVQVIRE